MTIIRTRVDDNGSLWQSLDDGKHWFRVYLWEDHPKEERKTVEEKTQSASIIVDFNHSPSLSHEEAADAVADALDAHEHLEVLSVYDYEEP